MGHATDHKALKAPLQVSERAQPKPQSAAGRKTARKPRAWTGAAMSHALLYG